MLSRRAPRPSSTRESRRDARSREYRLLPSLCALDRIPPGTPQREALRTNQGVKIADNQNTLRAGPRGPSLLEDFIMREKITHFDHERIP
ncbi:catalase, partial [Burkholderia gladioli]|uniref:catalase n=1 Tax=Burkholderia gladioli TaxID=28095 RepID=UPI0016422492